MKYKTVKLTDKMLNTLDHALGVLESDYSQSSNDELQPYQKQMLKKIKTVKRALLKARIK